MLGVDPKYTIKRLDDATENAKPHLQLHVFRAVATFAASRENVTVQD